MEGLGLGEGVEFDRIRAFVEAVGASGPSADSSLLPGDDAAVLDWPGGRLVAAIDVSVEEVHFRRAWVRWEAVGYRAAASSLSDLAAMAARPVGVLATLAIPPELETGVYESIGRGMGECLRPRGIPLLGGDLSGTPGPVVVDVAVLGSVDRAVTRAGARPGDLLWITGRLGGAAAAVHDWTRGLEPDPRARRAYERPAPRLEEASWLAGSVKLHAMIDLSDGLAGDAAHLAAASGVRLRIDVSRVPLAGWLEAYDNREAALGIALGGGEDYELLFAAPEGAGEPLRAEFERKFRIPLTRVGIVESGEGVRWVTASGEPVDLPASGFDHFSRRAPAE